MSRSVIIPAHNEGAVIGSTIERIVQGLDEGVAVLVVCNGCTDDTAEVATRASSRVQTAEISAASKVGALNVADGVLTSGSKAYVDADVLISGESLNRLFAAVAGPSGVAAEPVVEFDVTGSSWLVRSYYKVWNSLHGARPGDVGGGVYCLSDSARARFGAFPDVISDDGYVRAHFARGEIVRVRDAVSTVRVPRDLATLVKVKTRSRRGTAQLATRFPDLWADKVTASDSLGTKLRHLPLAAWPYLPVYVAVQMLIRFRADRSDESSGWERDETSRAGR